jgi:hypothetical protein
MNIEEVLPLVYTPTLGEGCQCFSEVWRKRRGVFLSYPNKHRIREILADPRYDEVRVGLGIRASRARRVTDASGPSGTGRRCGRRLPPRMSWMRASKPMSGNLSAAPIVRSAELRTAGGKRGGLRRTAIEG